MFKYFLLWFPMLVLAIINGALREWYIPFTGEPLGRQISTILLMVLFGFYIYWVVYKYPPGSSELALMVGLMWLILTLMFEFGFGFYRGNSFEQMLAEYNIFEGRLWILIPVWVTFAPLLFYMWKR